MKILKTLVACMLVGGLVSPAQAMLVEWDFGWERSYENYWTGVTTDYAGIGSFSYQSPAASDGVVTHGAAGDDELQSFGFEGFVDGTSIGFTNVLPSFFAFSPFDVDEGLIWAVDANTDGSSGDGGVGCLFHFCSLYEEGEKIWHSTGLVKLRGGAGGATALAEPGTLGLAGIGLLFSGLVARRRKKV